MVEVDAVEAVEASVLLPSPALETSTADAVPAVQGESAEALAERWLKFLDVSPKTADVYAGAIRVFLRWLRDRGIVSPSRADVLAYRDWLKQERAPATVSLYMTAVRLLFAWAEQESLSADVARRVKGSRIDRGHKKDSLTSAQAARLLESVDRSSLQGLRDYAILALMVTTGLRTISVVRANVGDLGTVGDSAVLRYQGKGHDERSEFVKLAPQTDAAIRAYLAARGPAEPMSPLFAVLSNRNLNGRMTTRNLSGMVKARLAAAGFCSPRLTAHSLRHTAATLSLLTGGTVEETQRLLGHASIETTMIYVHQLDRAASLTEGRIAEAIFGKAEGS
ncbi:MAG: site-specific integrase [Desulfovibrio sp.]|nr:site-specific integrase [Desulfovibrio sp.]